MDIVPLPYPLICFRKGEKMVLNWDLSLLDSEKIIYHAVFSDDDLIREPLVLEILQDRVTGIASLSLFWGKETERDIKKSRDIDYLKELALMSCGAYVQSIAGKHEDKGEDGAEI